MYVKNAENLIRIITNLRRYCLRAISGHVSFHLKRKMLQYLIILSLM